MEGFPLFVSGEARADASAATPGEGRLRRETVEGFPLFVGRRGPSLQASAALFALRNVRTCRTASAMFSF